jgi:hypothetical protein
MAALYNHGLGRRSGRVSEGERRRGCVRQAVNAHRLPWNEAAGSAYDLWGGHELGHAILDAYGINPGTRWLNELVASYVVYAYLASEHPEQLWLIDVLEVGGRSGQPQR